MPLTREALLAIGQPRPLPRLCEKCSGVVDCLESQLSEGSRDARFYHHETLQDFIASADGQCALCQLFRNSFQGAVPWKGPTTPVDSGTVIASYGYQLCLYIPYEDGDLSYDEDERNEVEQLYLTYLIQVGPHEDPGSEIFWQFRDRLLADERATAVDYDSTEPDTSTMDALPLCKLWLDDCRTTHTGCQHKPASHAASPPTRLIEISDPSNPRLSLVSEHPSAEYATLSHCWGKHKFTTLTTSNEPAFRQHIPDDALPKTFQDAIHAARVLGFSYLWIDSLCILQDSPQDWTRESAAMSQVYRGAGLNIAATWAKDGAGGCFQPRPRSWHLQVRASSSSSSSPSSSSSATDGNIASGPLYGCYAAGKGEDAFDWISAHRNRLGRRAWVVQERFLSRRTLHFARGQVFWECDGVAASETYPRGYPAAVFGEDRIEKLPGFGPEFALRRGALSRADWPAIVRWYSRSRLTMDTDRLVAIGGLARMIAESEEGESPPKEEGEAGRAKEPQYVAGLWREGLEWQLCWSYAASGKGRGQEVVPYTAPSWSWASLKGAEISTSKGKTAESTRLLIRILDVQVETASLGVASNIYGQLQGARLRVRCELLCDGNGSNLKQISFHLDPDSRVNTVFCNIEPDNRERKVSNMYGLFLPVSQSRGVEGVEGLMLRAIPLTQGKYRRVGYFWVPRGAPSDVFLAEAETKNLCRRSHASWFAMVGKDERGETQYCIDLV